MARTWRTRGRELSSIAGQQAAKLIRTQAPKLMKTLQQAGVIPVGQALPSGVQPGRPVTTVTAPTSYRARQVVYAPSLDGRADPGEVVWTWVEFEEDPSEGKDRPVLVVGRDHKTLLGLMLSSNAARSADPHWMGIGSGPWDHEGRPSWLRLDRILDVPEAGIRREGAILDRVVFDRIAERLHRDYGWG